MVQPTDPKRRSTHLSALHGAAVATARPQVTSIPTTESARTDATTVEPVVSTSSSSTTATPGGRRPCCAEADPARQVGGAAGGIQPDRVPGTTMRVQAWGDATDEPALCEGPGRCSGHRRHRIPAATAGRRAPAGGRDYPDLVGQQRDTAQPDQRRADRLSEQRGQVGPPAFLPGENRGPHRPGVPGERPDHRPAGCPRRCPASPRGVTPDGPERPACPRSRRTTVPGHRTPGRVSA